jgi:hypothetical protein
MRTEEEVRALLKHVIADDRLKRGPALVQINAPLALIQTELEARCETLLWVLGKRPHGGGSAGQPPEPLR